MIDFYPVALIISDDDIDSVRLGHWWSLTEASPHDPCYQMSPWVLMTLVSYVPMGPHDPCYHMSLWVLMTLVVKCPRGSAWPRRISRGPHDSCLKMSPGSLWPFNKLSPLHSSSWPLFPFTTYPNCPSPMRSKFVTLGAVKLRNMYIFFSTGKKISPPSQNWNIRGINTFYFLNLSRNLHWFFSYILLTSRQKNEKEEAIFVKDLCF
jgi:hypothetical protein